MTEEIHPEERKSNELRKKVKIHSLSRQAILFCVVFFLRHRRQFNGHRKRELAESLLLKK